MARVYCICISGYFILQEGDLQHCEACDQARALPARAGRERKGGEIKQEGAVGSALLPLVFTLS